MSEPEARTEQSVHLEAPSRDFILSAFMRLRLAGLSLGIGELLAALHAFEAGIGTSSMPELLFTLKLIWCKSTSDEAILARVHSQIEGDRATPALTKHLREHGRQPAGGGSSDLPAHHPPSDAEDIQAAQHTFHAGGFILPHEERSAEMPELRTYWPLSRRYMVYIWRYLRRPLPDGPLDVFDLNLTIENTTRAGLFLGPVLRRRVVNHAHLVLFLDQQGSMTPFHRYLRDLVETARDESGIDPESVEVYYFSNVPTDMVSLNPHLTDHVLLSNVLSHIDTETSVMIVSDAGAARGSEYKRGRVQATQRFLRQIRARTRQLAWLNPMPEERWTGTSAEAIADVVTMMPMDEEGFISAVDVLRNLKPSNGR